MNHRHTYRLAAWATLGCLLSITPSFAAAADEPPANDRAITLAEGHVHLEAAKGWVRKQPRTRIVDHEFAAPAVEGDEFDGRVTVMGAGGSVEVNIERWIGQFEQPDGTPSKQRTKIEKLNIAGQEVHYVDITGDYKDQPGPFAAGKPVLRENYRMLAGIIVTDKLGQYFIKLYGPRRTVAANEEAFKQVLQSLKVDKQPK